jgi:hypothetical protein
VVIVTPLASLILVALTLLLWKSTPFTALGRRRYRPRSGWLCRLCSGIYLLPTALTGTEMIELNEEGARNTVCTDYVTTAINLLSILGWLLT